MSQTHIMKKMVVYCLLFCFIIASVIPHVICFEVPQIFENKVTYNVNNPNIPWATIAGIHSK